MPKQAMWSIVAAVGIVIFGGVLFYAQPKDQARINQTAADATLNVSFDPAAYDFGTISMRNGLVTKSFQVKNSSGSDLYLSAIFTSCMCTSATLRLDGQEHGPFGMPGHGAMKMLNRKFGPGQAAELLVTFDPNAHGPSGIGLIERTVTIQSDKGETAVVNIKANVTP